MKSYHFSFFSVIIGSLLFGLNPVYARDTEKTVSGPKGNSIVKERSINRGGGLGNVSRSVTGENGRSYGVSKTRQSSIENGTFQSSKTVTGNSGASISKERSVDPNSGQSTVNRSYQGVNGNTYSYTKSREFDNGEGSMGTSKSYSGALVSKEKSIERGQGQTSINKSITAPNGATYGYDKVRETYVEDGVLQSTTTLTGKGGAQVSKDVTVTKSP